MTATNHALTGAVIGILVGQPWIAVPAAVASHFVCDAIPHFKVNLPDKTLLKTKGFRNYLIVDGSLCVLLVACLAVFQPQHWFLASVCAFLATSPDLFSINKYIKMRSGQRWRPNAYSKFADGIQWFSRPVGAVVEITWLVMALTILIPFFH